jgi:hypothetical protein
MTSLRFVRNARFLVAVMFAAAMLSSALPGYGQSTRDGTRVTTGRAAFNVRIAQSRDRRTRGASTVAIGRRSARIGVGRGAPTRAQRDAQRRASAMEIEVNERLVSLGRAGGASRESRVETARDAKQRAVAAARLYISAGEPAHAERMLGVARSLANEHGIGSFDIAAVQNALPSPSRASPVRRSRSRGAANVRQRDPNQGSHSHDSDGVFRF